LEASKDADVRAIYEQRKARVTAFTNRWSGPKELKNLEPIANHSLRFAGQIGRAGLGSQKSKYIANPTVEDRRAKVTETLRAQREEKHLEHAACLVQQGVWSHWDNVLPFDLSWKNLIYGPGPRIISFILNAQINSVGLHFQCLLRVMRSGDVHSSPYTRQLQICSRARSLHLET